MAMDVGQRLLHHAEDGALQDGVETTEVALHAEQGLEPGAGAETGDEAARRDLQAVALQVRRVEQVGEDADLLERLGDRA
jgi:ribosomal protein S11